MNNLIPPILQTSTRLKWIASLVYPFFLIKEKYEQYIVEKKYEARVTGQLMVLENYLNKIYDTEMRRIRIITREAHEYFIALQAEDYQYVNSFFVDPPYCNADMGSYDGYTFDNFRDLLNMLSKTREKFLLTTYPSEILAEYTVKNGWHTINNMMHLSSSNTSDKNKNEVFTMNYLPEVQ